MKTLTIILSLIISSLALAEDPAELVKLRKTWENSQAEAKKKAEEIYRSKNTKASKLYYDELYELKDNFMGAKNLQGAIAVDAEIKRLIETHGKMVVKVSEPQEEASPLDGVWIHPNKNGKNTMVLKGNKMVHWAGGIGEVTYTNQTIVIRWVENGWTHKLTQDPANPDLLTGVNNKGTTLRYTRLKW
jgi:hypothetical protein